MHCDLVSTLDLTAFAAAVASASSFTVLKDDGGSITAVDISITPSTVSQADITTGAKRFNLSGPTANDGDTWTLTYGGNTSDPTITSGPITVQAVADLFVGDIAGTNDIGNTGQSGYTAFRLAGTDDIVIVRFAGTTFAATLDVARSPLRPDFRLDVRWGLRQLCLQLLELRRR